MWNITTWYGHSLKLKYVSPDMTILRSLRSRIRLLVRTQLNAILGKSSGRQRSKIALIVSVGMLGASALLSAASTSLLPVDSGYARPVCVGAVLEYPIQLAMLTVRRRRELLLGLVRSIRVPRRLAC